MSCLLLTCLFAIRTSQAEKNVLLIMADDLNDWVGAMGGHPQVKTPNIDALAKKGVVFRNALCSSPVCLSSRTSMLTGLRPTTSGYLNNTSGFFRTNPKYKDIVTLPQFFKNKGYFAAKGGKIFHLGVTEPEDTISWNVFTNRQATGDAPNPYVHGLKTGTWGYSSDTKAETTGDWFSADYISQFIKKPGSKNFFLAYGSSKPHHPWYAPKSFFDLYDTNTLIMPEYLPNDLDDVPRPHFSGNVQVGMLAGKNWAKAVQGYLASITFADYCIGHVLRTLEASPYKDSTIVLIMGDHGFHLGEKGHWGKSTNWEEGTRTTLIIYDPTIAKPGIVDQTVSLQDIYPTIMDLTGNVPPKWVQGRSLRPILENPHANNFKGWALSNWHEGTAHTFRTDKWAIIRYDDRPLKSDFELYNMFTDPLQHTNIANQTEYAEILKKLSVDIDHIVKGEDPVNTEIYGIAPPVGMGLPGRKDLALALPVHKIYRLRAFGVNGKLVREFAGKGKDIERMIALGWSGLGLPQEKYVYRIFDLQNKLVQTVSTSHIAQ